MSQVRPSPEDVILAFSVPQLCQLLAELGLASTTAGDAEELRRLVRSLGNVEQAMQRLMGPAQMGAAQMVAAKPDSMQKHEAQRSGARRDRVDTGFPLRRAG